MAIGLPQNEEARLRDLYAYAVLDTDPEERFDDLVRLAAMVCGTTDARINFIDASRQWTKAQTNDGGLECSRSDSFCAHTILNPAELFVVEDTLRDDRFAQNPFVTCDPSMRFYAGAPLVTPSGHAIGSLCVFDYEPRTLSPEQADALRALAAQVVAQLELRRLLAQERETAEQLRELDRLRNDLINFVTHELRNPLGVIRGYAELLQGGRFGDLAEQQSEAVAAIDAASLQLLQFVDELLTAAQAADGDLHLACAETDLAAIVAAAVERVEPVAERERIAVSLTAPAELPLVADERRLTQVLDNLLSNAVKYTREEGTVDVRVATNGGQAVVEVSDTGIGIPQDELPSLFTRFFRASTATSSGIRGTGLGLAVVKTIVERHGGSVGVESEPGRGTTFRVVLPLP